MKSDSLTSVATFYMAKAHCTCSAVFFCDYPACISCVRYTFINTVHCSLDISLCIGTFICDALQLCWLHEKTHVRACNYASVMYMTFETFISGFSGHIVLWCVANTDIVYIRSLLALSLV